MSIKSTKSVDARNARLSANNVGSLDTSNWTHKETNVIAWQWLYSNGQASPIYNDPIPPDDDQEKAALMGEQPRTVRRFYLEPLLEIERLRAELAAIKGQEPVTADVFQFLTAVMDAAGLVRHGRQSKELSDYLGKECARLRCSLASPAPSAVVMPDHITHPNDYATEFARLNHAPAKAECKKCSGSGRIPIGGAGAAFGLTNRCFECCPVTGAEMATEGAGDE